MKRYYTQIKRYRTFQLRLEFVLQDMWVGLYWKRRPYQTDVYLCLIPCFPIHLTITDVITFIE